MSDRLQAATGGKAGPAASGFGRWIGGRASRREYWCWMVPLLVAEVLLSGLGMVVVIAFSVGRLLIWIRRLHDLGWSGWIAPAFNFFTTVVSAVLMATVGQSGALLASAVLLIAIIALGSIPGEARDNEFGPGPKTKTDLRETFS